MCKKDISQKQRIEAASKVKEMFDEIGQENQELKLKNDRYSLESYKGPKLNTAGDNFAQT
jgi:hypothetical protein